MYIKIISIRVMVILFFAMLTYTVCFKYQLKDFVYYWSDNVVTSREFTTYNKKKCLPLAHFTASTATDCHGKKCIGQSEPCQVNYGSSISTTQTVLALSFQV